MKESKKILVLGGTYFIGKAIVSLLVENNYQVTTLTRGTSEGENTNVDTIKCDRNDEIAMEKALTGKEFDIIIDISGLNQAQLEISTKALANANYKKYLFMSSSAVYALDKCTAPYHVGDSMGYNDVWTDYGQNKCDAELFLYKYGEEKGIEIIVIRPPYVYGENNYVQRESFIFDHIVKGKKIIVPGGGDTQIQFIYAKDLAKIVMYLFNRSFTRAAIYNVGNKKSITFNKWVAICAEIVGKKADIIHLDYKRHNIGVRDFFPFPNYDNILSTNLIDEIYDLEETPMSEGLKNCFEWYKKNADKIEFKQNVIETEEKILNIIMQNSMKL